MFTAKGYPTITCYGYVIAALKIYHFYRHLSHCSLLISVYSTINLINSVFLHLGSRSEKNKLSWMLVTAGQTVHLSNIVFVSPPAKPNQIFVTSQHYFIRPGSTTLIMINNHDSIYITYVFLFTYCM
jgi:hypothetical protein